MAYLTCCLLITLALVSFSLTYPWADNIPPPFMASTDCNIDDETERLCQRCAKSTKSPLAYPMCCGDKEDARNWCLHYITFGIQGESFCIDNLISLIIEAALCILEEEMDPVQTIGERRREWEKIALLTCCLLITLALVSFSLTYPWADNIPPPFMTSTDCNIDDETERLCQRCAKSTKSPLAYPMCCGDKEDARNWCLHYITFGIQGE